jgi:hypothetical protein
MKILIKFIKTIRLENLMKCHKKHFLLILIFLSIFLIFCISNAYYLYCIITDVRITTKSDVCALRIRQIAIAMQVYCDVYGTYPPPVSFDAAGKPIHSWRALILPYLDNTIDEKTTLNYDYSVPWDHPNNISLHYKMPSVFRCPCESDGNKSHCESSFDMIFDFENRDRIILPNSRKNLLLIEVFNTGVNWLQPISININDISKGVKSFDDPKPSIRPGSKHPKSNDDNKRYFRCVNDHGEVLNLPTDISPKLLEILAERDYK